MAGKPLRTQALERVGKNWSNASETRDKNLGNIRRLCDRIEEKFGLESIQNLKPHMIEAVFADMQAEGLASTTIAGYATAARTVAEGIGKANIVPRDNAGLGGSRASQRLKPKDVDRGALQAVRDRAVEAAGQWVGLAADMARDFGLRMAGSVSRFEVVQVDGRDYLRVTEKGGLTRHVPFENQRQVETAKAVFAHIREHGQTSLIPTGMTKKQGLNSLRTAWLNAGGTKTNNANFHCWRHAYVQERTGNDLASMARDEKEALVRAVGHFDTSKLRHYSK